MQTLGVVVNAEKQQASNVLSRMCELAEARGISLLVASDSPVAVAAEELVGMDELRSRAEAILVVGGDGTVLNTVRALDGRDIPLMGVNAGSLGFLTSVTSDEVEIAFDALIEGRTISSRQPLLACRIEHNGDRELLAYALNDCVISRGASGRIVCLEVEINGVPVADSVCDGLIVATPTGSTAYSLSAGGPIVLPETSATVISLICPHALGSRPLVIPDSSRVSVTVLDASAPATVSADGEVERGLAEGDRVIIEPSDRAVTFLHLDDYEPFAVMRQKLGWHAATPRARRKGQAVLDV